MKDLQEWKEAPIDCVVLSLFQLQVFYLNEVKRGLAGLGEYTLLPEFCDLHESFVQPYEGRSPQEIVQSIRDRQNTTDEENVATMYIMTTVLHIMTITVKGESGATRVVTLFPKVSCSCPSMNECYHIMTARMFLGMAVPSKQTKRNQN